MKKRTSKLWKGSTMLMALSVFLICLSSVSQTMAQELGENYTLDLPRRQALDMIWIEEGRFKMGTPNNDRWRQNNEQQHEVTISKGFWMGKTEVTQGQWYTVIGSSTSQYGGSDNLPVTGITWEDAMEFCKELTKMEKEAGNLPEGYKYTLPTEAQWEYACRAGTRTSLNSGQSITSEKGICQNLDKVGWYKENSSGTPHPVGKKQPNDWELCDMHGNVAEWCMDWYGDYPSSSVKDPQGPSWGSKHVIRGGSYASFAVECRSASRSELDRSAGSVGFRVVLVSEGVNITIPLSDKVTLDMIWIKPGTFMMGSPSGETGRFGEETQHRVTISKGYWLGKYEVTQAQYEAVMGTNPSKWKGTDLPVEKVFWKEAMEFCEKLTASEKAAGRLPEGYEYTLPTEAQWEYACRAGTTTALNSGKNLSDEWECPEMDGVGWYDGNSDEMTHPVGQKKPNAWGLYDMHGNVWEWCLDYCDWDGDTKVIVTDTYKEGIKDPLCTTGSSRVVRGGSWRYNARHCRSANRSYYAPGYRNLNIGFRVCLSYSSNP